MLDLMAVSTDVGPMPLYLHSVYRILREMRMVQQETRGAFNYLQFKNKILSCSLTPHQLAPLEQRLETLESFMPNYQTGSLASDKKLGEMKGASKGTDWASKVC